MKKCIISAVVGAIVFAGSVFAQSNGVNSTGWEGYAAGGGVRLDAGVVGAIQIGDGQGLCAVSASNAVQIGTGSNGVSGTMKFRNKWAVLSTTSDGAVDVASLTNLFKSASMSNAVFGTAGNKLGMLYGVCTNGQVISFVPEFSAIPCVTATWRGTPTTNGNISPVLHLTTVSTAAFVVDSLAPNTNSIIWTAVGPR